MLWITCRETWLTSYILDTSKYPLRPGQYGSSGTFLASLAALSLISIASHHRQHNSHNSLIIHNSDVIARHVPAPPEHRVLTFSHGTRVVVRDLFGSMPVRVKHRALEIEKSGYSKDFERLGTALVSLMIAWLGEVAVSLKDANGRNMLSLGTVEPGGRQGNSCEFSDTQRILARAPRLLAQASLFDGASRDLWVPIGASSPGISVGGCVCLRPVATKRLQFVAIGIEPLTTDSRFNVLHEEVNRVFANSAFGAVDEDSGWELDGDGQVDAPKAAGLRSKKGVDRWPIFYFQISLEESLSATRTGVEDLLAGSTHTLTAITDLLRAMSFEFLKKHHFRPKSATDYARSGSTTSEAASPSPDPSSPGKAPFRPVSMLRSDRSYRSLSPGGGLARSTGPASSPAARETPGLFGAGVERLGSDLRRNIKSGQLVKSWGKITGDTITAAKGPIKSIARPHGGSDVRRKRDSLPPVTSALRIDASGALLRKPFIDVDNIDLDGKNRSALRPFSAHTEEGNKHQEKNETTLSLSKPGIDSLDSDYQMSTDIERRAGLKTSASPTARAGSESDTLAPASTWIQDIISTWAKPAFALTERPIPWIPDLPAPGGLRVGDRNANRGAMADWVTFGEAHEDSSMQLMSRISAQALRKAEVVGQADGKFILIKVPLPPPDCGSDPLGTGPSTKSLLAVVDQHAADERCKVESLMKTYFLDGGRSSTVQVEALERPLRFELSEKEGQLLFRYQKRFLDWGIIFRDGASQNRNSQPKPSGNGGSNVLIEVQSLPPSILERCRLEPRLLIDLLRKEIWKLDEESNFYGPSQDTSGGHEGDLDWVRRFHGCPEGILDLINSRACRSGLRPASISPRTRSAQPGGLC